MLLNISLVTYVTKKGSYETNTPIFMSLVVHVMGSPLSQGIKSMFDGLVFHKMYREMVQQCQL